MPRRRDVTGKCKSAIGSKLISTPAPTALRAAPAGLLSTTMLFAAGCSRAPTFNILGSFFPSWILCGLIGLLLTGLLRIVFVRTKFEQELSPLVLVYPCLTAFFTFTLWLLFFS